MLSFNLELGTVGTPPYSLQYCCIIGSNLNFKGLKNTAVARPCTTPMCTFGMYIHVMYHVVCVLCTVVHKTYHPPTKSHTPQHAFEITLAKQTRQLCPIWYKLTQKLIRTKQRHNATSTFHFSEEPEQQPPETRSRQSRNKRHQ